MDYMEVAKVEAFQVETASLATEGQQEAVMVAAASLVVPVAMAAAEGGSCIELSRRTSPHSIHTGQVRRCCYPPVPTTKSCPHEGRSTT